VVRLGPTTSSRTRRCERGPEGVRSCGDRVMKELWSRRGCHGLGAAACGLTCACACALACTHVQNMCMYMLDACLCWGERSATRLRARKERGGTASQYESAAYQLLGKASQVHGWVWCHTAMAMGCAPTRIRQRPVMRPVLRESHGITGEPDCGSERGLSGQGNAFTSSFRRDTYALGGSTCTAQAYRHR